MEVVRAMLIDINLMASSPSFKNYQVILFPWNTSRCPK
jgi:hypothetical protein